MMDGQSKYNPCMMYGTYCTYRYLWIIIIEYYCTDIQTYVLVLYIHRSSSRLTCSTVLHNDGRCDV